MYNNVPEELKELKAWCCYKLVFDEKRGKNTKLPYNAYTGELAKSNDESTWCEFDVAVESVEKYGFSGIGFFFKPPYFGIDIDGIEGELKEYLSGQQDDKQENIVSEFVELMCSYSEISVSGKGIHIIAKGELPPGGRRKGNVEMYSDGRFFVVSGNHIGDYTHIADDSDYGKINYLHNKYIAKSEVSQKNASLENSPGNNMSEDRLMEIASKSKNGTRIQLFINGGWEQFYDSQSEADMSFANDLAFWTNRDFTKMDSIFRSSSLFREKWDRKQNDSTYGAETLNKAIMDCSNVFSPRETSDDFNLFIEENDFKPINNKMFSYDDTGNAQRFKDSFGEVVRFSYARKSWYYYNDKIWVTDQEGRTKNLADEVIEKMKNEKVYVSEDVDESEARKSLGKHVKSTRNNRGKTNMIKESEHLLSVKTEAFDGDPNLFNVQNGYLDLRTGKLHEHDKNKFFTKISSVEYTDKIDCPLWMDFLNTIFGKDQELINYIQRSIGYSLSGSTEEQMMFILYGNGRNGKSVFLDIITEIFGNYSTNIQPQTIMVKQQSSNANSDIAKLNGARLVTTTEPNEGVRMDEGLVKQLTGGDKVTARFLYENEFDFIPQFKLWMATNHKPIIRGTDDGIWRRMAIIPFLVQIPENEVDKSLKYKLRRELKAILNWAVEGYIMWRETGLEEPQCIKSQRKEYRTEMDSIEAFLEECCVRNEKSKAKAKTLYQAYREWARENGQYMMSSTKFGREMSNKFAKLRSNGIYYGGLMLNSEYNGEGFRMHY